jgi:hypothetical protein
MGLFRRTPADEDSATPSFEERLAQIGPGVPGRCPACDGLGYIDSIDIGHRYQIQHCKDCLHRWEYLFDSDGNIVGLTELDSDGRPVARSRVRTRRDVEPEPAAEADPEAAAEPEGEADPGAETDRVVDLRETVADPSVPDLEEATELSPAEWLRQSARR